MADPDTANGYYRAVLPLTALGQRGHTVTLHHAGAALNAGYRLPPCDVLFLHRGSYPEHVELVRRCVDDGVAVVWDNDDDISALPKVTRRVNGHSRRATRQVFKRSVEIARRATAMTTPSDEIARIYREAGIARTVVIKNQVATVERARSGGDAIVLGYTGAAEHAEDLEKLRLVQTFERLLDAHPRLRIVSVGIDLGLRDRRYTCHGYVDFRSLGAIVRGFDVGIAPLLDGAFNRSRSDIKLKEYAAAGATWLASPIGPYRDLGEEQGGLLVADGDWHDALDRVLGDDALRARLTRQAGAWARTQTIRATAAAWEAALQQAVATIRGSAAAPRA